MRPLSPLSPLSILGQILPAADKISDSALIFPIFANFGMEALSAIKYGAAMTMSMYGNKAIGQYGSAMTMDEKGYNCKPKKMTQGSLSSS